MEDNYYVEIEITGEKYAEYNKKDLQKLNEKELFSLQYDLRGVKSYFHTFYEISLDIDKVIEEQKTPVHPKVIEKYARYKRIYFKLEDLDKLIKQEIKDRYGD